MLDFVKYLETASRTPVRLRILDLILLDSTTFRPYKWIYTDHNDCLQFRRLENISFARIAGSLLTNMGSYETSPAANQSADGPMLRYKTEDNEIACFGTDTHGRVCITVGELRECRGLSGRFSSIQVFKNPIKRFEPYMYFSAASFPVLHRSPLKDHAAVDSRYWKTHLISKNGASELPLGRDEEECRYALSSATKSVSLVIEHATHRRVRSIVACFVIHRDSAGSEMETWLMGCEDVILDIAGSDPLARIRMYPADLASSRLDLTLGELAAKATISIKKPLKVCRRSASFRRDRGSFWARVPARRAPEDVEQKSEAGFRARCGTDRGLYQQPLKVFSLRFPRPAGEFGCEAPQRASLPKKGSSGSPLKSFQRFETLDEFRDYLLSVVGNPRGHKSPSHERRSPMRKAPPAVSPQKSLVQPAAASKPEMECTGRLLALCKPNSGKVSRRRLRSDTSKIGVPGKSHEEESKSPADDSPRLDSEEPLTKPVFNILIRRARKASRNGQMGQTACFGRGNTLQFGMFVNARQQTAQNRTFTYTYNNNDNSKHV